MVDESTPTTVAMLLKDSSFLVSMSVALFAAVHNGYFCRFVFRAMKTSTPTPRFRSTIVHRWLFFSLIVLLAVMYPLAVLRPLVVSRARRRKVNRQIRIEEVVNAEVSALSALVLHLEDYFRYGKTTEGREGERGGGKGVSCLRKERGWEL